jgi:putative transposase
MEEGRVKKSSHCAWQIHYHIVFPVKYRKALLDEEVERIIVETARGIEERYDIEFEQIGCDRDHIHKLCAAHPKVAPGQIVRVFKSLTAREIFRAKPSVKKALWGGQFWTDGYYVATVGERGDWNVVERYVRNQGKPKEELRQLKLF